jgi:hypothetical protein
MPLGGDGDEDSPTSGFRVPDNKPGFVSACLCTGAYGADLTKIDRHIIIGFGTIKEIPIGGEEGWDELTMDTQTCRLCISRANRVQVLDDEKGTVIGEVKETAGR